MLFRSFSNICFYILVGSFPCRHLTVHAHQEFIVVFGFFQTVFYEVHCLYRVGGERKGRIRNLRKNGVALSTAEGRTRPGDRNREASTRLLLRGPPVPRKSLSHAAGIPRLLRHTPFPSIPTPRITHPSTKIKCRCRISVKPRSTPAHGYRVPPFALISPRPLFFSVDAPRAHV